MLLGMRKAGKIPWEVEVASLAPLIWAKFNEATSAAFTSNGNFGSASVTGWSIVAPVSSNFGSTPIMPSDLTRTTILNNVAGFHSASTVVPNMNNTAMSIYCAVKLFGTGTAALIPWRDGNSGADFIRFDGTFCVVRVRNIDTTTTIANTAIMNNVAHLIGLVFDASSFDLWIDGVKVFTSAVAGTPSSSGQWDGLQNGNNAGQKPYGNYGDQIVWNRKLTNQENLDLYAAWS